MPQVSSLGRDRQKMYIVYRFYGNPCFHVSKEVTLTFTAIGVLSCLLSVLRRPIVNADQRHRDLSMSKQPSLDPFLYMKLLSENNFREHNHLHFQFVESRMTEKTPAL